MVREPSREAIQVVLPKSSNPKKLQLARQGSMGRVAWLKSEDFHDFFGVSAPDFKTAVSYVRKQQSDE
eukprot:UN34151